MGRGKDSRRRPTGPTPERNYHHYHHENDLRLKIYGNMARMLLQVRLFSVGSLSIIAGVFGLNYDDGDDEDDNDDDNEEAGEDLSKGGTSGHRG